MRDYFEPLRFKVKKLYEVIPFGGSAVAGKVGDLIAYQLHPKGKYHHHKDMPGFVTIHNTDLTSHVVFTMEQQVIYYVNRIRPCEPIIILEKHFNTFVNTIRTYNNTRTFFENSESDRITLDIKKEIFKEFKEWALPRTKGDGGVLVESWVDSYLATLEEDYFIFEEHS